MNGATFVCNRDTSHYLTRFTSEPLEKRMACLRCEGWMQAIEQPGETYVYKKPNLFWRFVGWIVMPIINWVEKHAPYDDEDD